MHQFIRYLVYLVIIAIVLNYRNVQGFNLLTYTLIGSLVLSSLDYGVVMITDLSVKKNDIVEEKKQYNNNLAGKSTNLELDQRYGERIVIPGQSIRTRSYIHVPPPTEPIYENKGEVAFYSNNTNYESLEYPKETGFLDGNIMPDYIEQKKMSQLP